MTTTATTITVDSLPTASTIDAVNDRLLIYTASATDIQGISRNVLLGLTSQPVGINDNQTLTNKTVGITNTLTALDTLFTLQDNGDNTKQAMFQLSGITTGTTRTYTLPNSSSTLMDLVTVQTATNKTFTAPVITGGSIDNTAVTIDTLSGHTSTNVGTVYGVGFNAGTLTGLANNTIAAANLATNAITLGYAQITTTFTTSATSATQVTGLTATVTIPAGGRRIKITALGKDVFTNTGAAAVTLSIWDGTVGSGTQLSASAATLTAASTANFVETIAVVTPAAGSKTYNVGIFTSNSSDAANLEAASTAPAFILVEAI